MRKILVVLAVLIAAALPCAAQKARYSQSQKPDPLMWPLTIHVTHARVSGLGTAGVLHLDAVIDGLKVELETPASGLLHVGDYQGRVLSQDEKKSGWFSRTYELLFSDGTHVAFTEVAESE